MNPSSAELTSHAVLERPSAGRDPSAGQGASLNGYPLKPETASQIDGPADGDRSATSHRAHPIEPKPKKQVRQDGNDVVPMGPTVEAVVRATARGWSVWQISEVFLTPKSTLYRWMKKTWFQAAVEEHIRQRATIRAALLGVLEDKSKMSAATRVEAARLLIEHDRLILPDRSKGHRLFDLWHTDEALTYLKNL